VLNVCFQPLCRLLCLSQRGGVDLSSPSVKLFWCIEVQTVRGGAIAESSGAQFCVKPRCTTKTHIISQVNLRNNHFYIHGNRKDQALLEPSLDASQLPTEVEPSPLASKAQPRVVGRAYFGSEKLRTNRAIIGMRGDSEQSWEEVEALLLEKLSCVNIDYQTPKKMKVGVLLEAMPDTAPIGIGKAEAIGQIEDHMAWPSGDERETTVELLINLR
jgi:hypothetical protein